MSIQQVASQGHGIDHRDATPKEPTPLGDLERAADVRPPVSAPPPVTLNQEPTSIAMDRAIAPRPTPPADPREIALRLLREYEAEPEQRFNVAKLFHLPGTLAEELDDPFARMAVEPVITDELWVSYGERLHALAVRIGMPQEGVDRWFAQTMESRTAQLPRGRQFVRQQAAKLIAFMEQQFRSGLVDTVSETLELLEEDTNPDQSIASLAHLRVRLQVETIIRNPFLDRPTKMRQSLAFIITQYKIDIMRLLFIGRQEDRRPTGSSSSSAHPRDGHALFFYNLRRYADVLDIRLPINGLPQIEVDEASAGDYEQTLRYILRTLIQPERIIQYLMNSHLMTVLDDTPEADELWQEFSSRPARQKFKCDLEARGAREAYLAECGEEIKQNLKRGQIDSLVRLLAMEMRVGKRKIVPTTEGERRLAMAKMVLGASGIENPPLEVIR